MPKLIKPEDDLFHARSGSPYWNESGWFQFMIPERKIDGMVHFYHRPNMHKSSGGIALWDPSGEEMHDCLFYEFDEHLALPPAANMFDFELDNTLTCKTNDLQKSYTLRFGREGYELDLTWNAAIAPHSQREPTEPDDDPGVVGWTFDDDTLRGDRPVAVGAGYTTGHYEQVGRMEGTVTLDGERLAVNCWSCRDHSWGTRRLSPEIPRNRFDWAMSTEGNAFGIVSVADQPWNQDPVVGVTDRVIHGWYVKDGAVGDVTSGTSRVVERDGDGRQLRVVVDAQDNLGRTLHAEGLRENALNYFWYSFFYATESLASWQWDGFSDFGETYEWCNQRQSRRIRQAAKQQNGVLTA